jgi:hypothetical protein
MLGLQHLPTTRTMVREETDRILYPNAPSTVTLQASKPRGRSQMIGHAAVAITKNNNNNKVQDDTTVVSNSGYGACIARFKLSPFSTMLRSNLAAVF